MDSSRLESLGRTVDVTMLRRNMPNVRAFWPRLVSAADGVS